MINLSLLEKRPVVVALLFVAAALFLRIFSCFPTVLDHDESTYIVIANEWLSGEQLYKDLIDIKPPGIFIIYRLLLSICSSVVFTRLFAAVVVGISAFLLYLLHRHYYKDSRAALWAGGSYIVMISTFVWYGLSVNTELYFNFFTILSFWCFTNQKWFIGAALMGFGFIIKYMVLFDFVAFMWWFLLAWYWTTPHNNYVALRRLLVRMILAAIIMIIPFVLCHYYFYKVGLWNEFYYIIYTAPKRYVSSGAMLKRAQMLGDFLLRFLPFTFLALYTLWRTPSTLFRWQTGSWLLLSAVAVLLPGNRFGHYTIQLMLPTAWLAGSYFVTSVPQAFRFRGASIVGYAIMTLLVSGAWVSQYIVCIQKPDIVQQTANYLNARLQSNEQIYTGNEQQILYFLTQRNCPIPYVHRSLLFDPKHIYTLQIDTTAVVASLIQQKPAYIIQNKRFPNGQLQAFVDSNYELVNTIGNQINIQHRCLE